MVKKVAEVLLKVCTILLFPVLLLVGLLIMLFAAVISLWQQLTISKDEQQKRREEETTMLALKQQWSIFTILNEITIKKQFAGSLPWDSGDYFCLESDPEIFYLQDKYFGDWFVIDFGGVFLQKWNYPGIVNCDLVFIDSTSLRVIELQKHILSKSWSSVKTDSNEIRFEFLLGNSSSIYEIGLEEINKILNDPATEE